MTAFEHLLVPIDFGEEADKAIDIAISLATKFDSRLTLLHASWTPPPSYAAYSEAIIVWPTEEIAKVAEKQLAAVLAKARTKYPRTDSVLVIGNPWETILEVAKEQHASLIVMGTHGRRGLSRMLLGSIAEKVVRLSPIPVLVT